MMTMCDWELQHWKILNVISVSWVEVYRANVRLILDSTIPNQPCMHLNAEWSPIRYTGETHRQIALRVENFFRRGKILWPKSNM